MRPLKIPFPANPSKSPKCPECKHRADSHDLRCRLPWCKCDMSELDIELGALATMSFEEFVLALHEAPEGK